MAKIDLPRCHWFVSRQGGRFVTNAYSGSMGTLSDKGCVSVRTFNYHVYVDISSEEENGFRLIVESCIIQPWSLGGEKTDFERAEFESSEKGVGEASKWLVLTAAKYGF